MASVAASGTIVEMNAIRHIRIRRHESLPRRAWGKIREFGLVVLAATLVARRFWRHRPPLLNR